MSAIEVAIVDDDEDQREVMALRVKKEGFKPKLITKDDSGHFATIDQLIDKISTSDLVLCDHKLSHGNFANFYGSQLVAALYYIGKPAILITQYTDTPPDEEYILRYRRKLPTVLSRDKSDEVLFDQLFKNAANELKGNPPVHRKPHRVFLKIDDIYGDGNHTKNVIAFVPDWRADRAVSFPMDLISETIRDKAVAGAYLIAQVNTGALDANDLFFSDFEMPPEPMSEDELRKSLYP